MNNEDVYLKYPVKSSEWELYHPFKNSLRLKETMMWYIDYNCSEMVRREINKFDDINKYYVRKMFRVNFFKNHRYTVKNNWGVLPGDIWKVYNFDPFGRVFPYFMEDCESDYYKSVDDKRRYAYCVIYDDNIVTSENYKNNNKYGYKESLINDKVPRMMLTTTSLEGETIVCLDVVE